MFESSLRHKKLDPRLLELLDSSDCPATISVIVQTVDDPTEADEKLINTLKGRVLEKFTIIPALVAELSPKALESIILSDRVEAVTYNSKLF